MSRFVRLAANALAVAVPLLVTLDRLRRPTGDKFVFTHLGGSADLWAIYRGGLAITRHLDPYGPLPNELLDPSGWPAAYPPQTFAIFLPLVLATRGDFEVGAQAFYWVNIVATVCLAFATAALIGKASGARGQGVFLTALIAVSLNPLTMFALDRGQSEMVGAALAWGGVCLFAVRREYVWAITLLTLSSAIKGYAAPLTLGLLLSIPDRKAFLRALGAAALVSLAVTLPALPYLRSGMRALSDRLAFFFLTDWFNHSFKSVFHQFSPEHSDAARKLACLCTFVLAAIAGWRVFRSARGEDARGFVLDVVVFAGLATGLMIGLPEYSGPYNYLLFLPALMICPITFPSLIARTTLSLPSVAALGALCLFSLWGGLQVRWIGSPLSLSGLGLLGYIFAAGWVTFARLRSGQTSSVRSS